MFRAKVFIPLFVLMMLAVAALPVLATSADADTCLKTTDHKCYATNNPYLYNPTQPRNGTQQAPWLASTTADMAARYTDVQTALATGQYPDGGFFYQIACQNPNTTDFSSCVTSYSQFDNTGKLIATGSQPGIPTVGVPFPAPYLLLVGVIVAVLLIGAGLILRQRARAVNV